jgi:hypothetical protein
VAAGASRSEGRGDDGTRDSAWPEGVAADMYRSVVIRPRVTSGRQRCCDEPRWSQCGSHGWTSWYEVASA